MIQQWDAVNKYTRLSNIKALYIGLDLNLLSTFNICQSFRRIVQILVPQMKCEVGSLEKLKMTETKIIPD